MDGTMALRDNALRNLLNSLPRPLVNQWAGELGADKYAKVHRSASDLYANVYGSLSEVDSLTHLQCGLSSNPFLWRTFGYQRPISLSQLSRDNATVNPELYWQAFDHLVDTCRRLGIYRWAKKLKKYVVSVDGCFLQLNPKVFRYAKQGYCPMEEGVRWGAKAHIALNVMGGEPRPIAISPTTGEVNDTTEFEGVADKVRRILPNEHILWVMDMGYWSIPRFQELEEKGETFITPLRSDVKGYKVEIRQKYHGTGLGDYVWKHIPTGTVFRLVVARLENGRKIRLLTNNWRLSPKTIVELYRGRWDSEVFNKAVKQYFSIARPFGTTWNAFVVQVVSAFIAYLLLLIFRFLYQPMAKLLEVKRRMEIGWWLPMAEFNDGGPRPLVKSLSVAGGGN